jgi:MOSC domain-containing protein YiiM
VNNRASVSTVTEMGILQSVNLGSAEPNPYKGTRSTGIGKQPQPGPVTVRDPGPRRGGLGSGVVGDFIGDVEHHGGSEQAVYAFAREDLDDWQLRLARHLPNGFFGENLTTLGVEVNDARIGERWLVGGQVELVVTVPRIPCSTFRGWVGERGWLKVFTQVARPGAYLAVAVPGQIAAGDPITVTDCPEHDVTISRVFQALTTDPGLLPTLLPAAAHLSGELLDTIAAHQFRS